MKLDEFVKSLIELRCKEIYLCLEKQGFYFNDILLFLFSKQGEALAKEINYECSDLNVIKNYLN